ncbi:peptide-methionine (S)-S-oxide reductase MsrA [Actinomyces sp. B33]|uniref:peptide-methionine (S)-S-oxide reductase MsrA n=1 Tax=Actinomyces sp. B33 TaxID=2942131 RepID=UPI002340493B|nr:peptide-methionine (S)-S-oxide reductase MsrA [Actinomyces sp. B33]MDC4232599.1 peptide-methionine (S)-S-oxide reductase MsrA [Actinomyces sp. B33]
MKFLFKASDSPVRLTTHMVLGTPVDLEPTGSQQAIHLAAGCFWGVEKAMWSLPGVVATATGYMGGDVESPTYEQVCTRATGHAETVRVVFDADLLAPDRLIASFFEIHDPTQADGQGNDVGPQYRSAIWTTTPDQAEAAVRVRDAYGRELAERGFGPITTTIAPAAEAGPFWYAEDYHQQYLFKNPGGYECHARTGIPCPLS